MALNKIENESLEPNQFGGDYIKLSDVKTAGTDGGSLTAATWATRDLNTEDNDTGGICTLATNRFSIPAGTYRIRASAPGYQIDQNKIRLYNFTDSAEVIKGQSAHNVNEAHALLSGEFTIAGTKEFEIQHRSATTKATNGRGVAGGFDDEVFTVVELWKVK